MSMPAQPVEPTFEETTKTRLDRIEYELSEMRSTLGVVIVLLQEIGKAVGVERAITEATEKLERIAARRRKPPRRK